MDNSVNEIVLFHFMGRENKKGFGMEYTSYLQQMCLRRIRINGRKWKPTEKKRRTDRNRLARGRASMGSPRKSDFSERERSRLTSRPDCSSIRHHHLCFRAVVSIKITNMNAAERLIIRRYRLTHSPWQQLSLSQKKDVDALVATDITPTTWQVTRQWMETF